MQEAQQKPQAIKPGSSQAGGELLPQVYEELRRLAAYRLAHEPPGQTLQATALVHEAYLRLLRTGCDHWEDSRHFFNAIAEAMRRIMVESARRKRSAKRGGGLERANIVEAQLAAPEQPEELLAMDEALERLNQVHPDEAQLVKLRYFVGLTQEETARVLGISRRSVNSRWALARAWLYRELYPDHSPPSPPQDILHK